MKKDDIEKRLSSLEAAVEDIQRKLTKLLPQEKGKRETERIGDWILNLRQTGGCSSYWYAGKMIDGKRQWVYVGKDKALAADKIRQWEEKNARGIDKSKMIEDKH